jgi:hypothetical protein
MAAMQDLKEEAEHAVAIEAAEMNLVRLLGLHPFPDGNMWCVLWGEPSRGGGGLWRNLATGSVEL